MEKRVFVWLYIFSLGTCSLNDSSVIVTESSCPMVSTCACINEDIRFIQCHSIGHETLKEIEKIYGKNIETLEIEKWEESFIDFNNFTQFSKLRELQIFNSEIENIFINSSINSLEKLELENDEIENDEIICNLLDFLPNLAYLSLTNNYLKKFDCFKSALKLKTLKLRKNSIEFVDLPDSLENLDISFNSLTNIENIAKNKKLVELDLSFNRINEWNAELELPKLKILNISGLRIKKGFGLYAPRLEELIMNQSILRYLNFYKIRTENLKRFSATKSIYLESVAGRIPAKLENMTMTDTQIMNLPVNFFEKKQLKLLFSSSNIQCEPCVLKWSLPVFDQIDLRKICNLTMKDIKIANCSIGIGKSPIIYGKYSDDTLLRCFYYGDPIPKITWYRYRPSELLGTYDPDQNIIDYSNVTNSSLQSYSIIDGGHLLIRNPNRSHIERYVCVAENQHGKVHEIINFRLDYSDWYSFDVFHSVFYGGLATSLIVCFVSFLLNITWILTRKSALWWIQRAERLSRVRKMVEAMEKYRVRQMESLHEKYTKRVQIVRDNYHQQVEALRVSYTSQSEKFRDYRAAQLETVSSHLESMRDNYNTQLARVREYGAKRADTLWDSYEKQVNRMRTFSLQHRLKLMRQYKVKQRYLNKLLESFQAMSPEQRLEHEDKIREALDIPNDPIDIDSAGGSRLSRSSSFHSLPEYLIDERGNIQPGIPPSSQTIRFSNIQPLQSPSSSSTPLHNQPSTSSSSPKP